jgi:hypothetical protein
MKFSPVRMDEKPVMKTPIPARITLEFEKVVLYGV